MITPSPKHLVLDASAVAALCTQGDRSKLSDVLNSAQGNGIRVWFYAGECADLVRWSNIEKRYGSDSGGTSALSPLRELEQVQPRAQWLSALAGDLQDNDDPDPIACALIQAAARLEGRAWVVTADKSRVQRGAPFVTVENLAIPESGRQVGFIDLETQQDLIRTDLEEGIHRVLHHGCYVMGEEISRLEAQLAEMSGAAHCVCVSSGTDALLAALMAIEIKRGDEVITSPFTFFGTGEAIALLGGVPIYVDIDPETFNLDPSGIEGAIGSRTRAIMPVSLYGQCAEMDAIKTIARRHALPVIEDAAQSFGASFYGRRSCALSDLACTSFFPAKPLGAYGDGGAWFTQDASLADRLRQIRDHGQESRYHHTVLGINGRMDTIQAAILTAKLKIFPDEIVARQRVADRYAELLADLADEGSITLPAVRSYNTSTWAQYTIRVTDREEIRHRLGERGIPSAVHYPVPLYDQPALAQSGQNCPESDRAAREVLSLPMHPYLDDVAQIKVAQALRGALSSAADKVSQRDVAGA